MSPSSSHAPETGDDATTRGAIAYFDALARRDADAMAACWRPGSVDRFVGDQDLPAPDGVRQWFAALFAAFPDWTTEVLATTTEGTVCAVRWRSRGTFTGPGTFNGLAPTGARLEVEGCDVVEVMDGLVVGNSAYINQADVARQLGLLPPAGSAAERGMTGLFNAKTRVQRRLGRG